MNPMNEVQISKATVSIGVGEAGEKIISCYYPFRTNVRSNSS